MPQEAVTTMQLEVPNNALAVAIKQAIPFMPTNQAVAEQQRVSALDYFSDAPWVIQSEMLNTLHSIATRTNESVDVVAARLGRPLQNTRTVEVRNGIAVVPVNGPIMRYANLFTEISGATSLEILARDFSAAVADPSITAVILNIDSPGGQASGIAEFAQMIRAANKPVVAYVDGMGASGAYWIAAAADEIVLSKTAEVGSIGSVISMRKQDQSGVIEIVSSQSPNKRPDPNTPEGRSQYQARLDALSDVFIADVAEYRGVSVEKVLADFGKGDVRMGEEAVALGMADRVSTLENVITSLAAGITPRGSHNMADTQGKPAAQQPAITREYIAAHHPEVADALRSEGAAASAAQHATTERERIQSVMAQSMPGHEKLINALAFDGKTTGPEAAVQVLNAERTARSNVMVDLKADAPKPVQHAAEQDQPDASTKTPAEKARAKWDADPKLQAEFAGNYATYEAYVTASEEGKVSILGKTRAA